MAALYEERGDEVHVYPYRSPSSTGGEPWLTWSWVQYFLAIVFLSVVCFMLYYGLVLNNLLKFVFELSVLAFLVWRIVHKSKRVVFSKSKKQVWKAFLSFKWSVVPFKDIAEVRLQDRELLGRPHYLYVAMRRNQFIPPFPISYAVTEMDRLDLFTNEVLPLLQEMLPGGDEAAEVAVDEVEIPVEEAEKAIAASETVRRTGTSKRHKLFYFREKAKIYSISVKKPLYGILFIAVALALGTFAITMLQESRSALYVPWIIVGVTAVACIIIMPDVNTDMAIDMTRRMFVYRTKFGFKSNEVPFENLITFNIKESHGIVRLCMVLEGVDYDPNLCVTRSPETAKAIYNEVCSILNLNPNVWFDG